MRNTLHGRAVQGVFMTKIILRLFWNESGKKRRKWDFWMMYPMKLGEVLDVSQIFCTNSRTYLGQLAKRHLRIYNKITKGLTEKRTREQYLEVMIMELRSQEVRTLAPENDPLKMGMGWKVEDLSKPQILVESTFGDSHPGSAHLDQFVKEAVQAVNENGGKAARYFATDM